MTPLHLPPLFLASRSPRRKALLEEWGVSFRAVEPGPEGEPPGREPFEEVLSRAREKCLAADLPTGSGPGLVLSADTLVVAPGGRILGKPGDPEEARSFLSLLSGASHLVVSGVWARSLSGKVPGKGGVETSRVRFRSLDRREIESYLEGGEWRGKAGAYALQGEGSRFILEVEGEKENVIGLPRALTLFLLEDLARPRGETSWTSERS